MKNAIRKWLGINEDMAHVTEDVTKLVAMMTKNGSDTFELFHALPFVAGIISLKAQDAAAFTNVNALQKNGLYPILTTIVMAARQGQSYLQVEGELTEFVRAQLVQRGFRVEDTVGTNDAKGLFIIWT